jgi:hypothetical protein
MIAIPVYHVFIVLFGAPIARYGKFVLMPLGGALD